MFDPSSAPKVAAEFYEKAEALAHAAGVAASDATGAAAAKRTAAEYGQKKDAANAKFLAGLEMASASLANQGPVRE